MFSFKSSEEMAKFESSLFLSVHSFGEHERRFLSSELSPLLESLASAASVEGGSGQASAMSFTRTMEEVRA